MDFDDLEGLKKKKTKIRGDRGWLATNPPMMKLVPFFQKYRIPNFQGLSFLGSKNAPLIVGDKCLYRFMETVIYLITSPKIEELGRLGGNFHNCYGTYIARSCFP